jgi:hypothetical protein
VADALTPEVVAISDDTFYDDGNVFVTVTVANLQINFGKQKGAVWSNAPAAKLADINSTDIYVLKRTASTIELYFEMPTVSLGANTVTGELRFYDADDDTTYASTSIELLRSAAPTVSSVSPSGFFMTGGETITIVIDHFPTGATAIAKSNVQISPTASVRSVTSSNMAAPGNSPDWKTTVTFLLPISTAGDTTFTVSNRLSSGDDAQFTFNYWAAPTENLAVTATPSSGDMQTYTSVTLIVENFVGTHALVDFCALAAGCADGTGAVDATVLSTTVNQQFATVKIMTPEMAAGAVKGRVYVLGDRVSGATFDFTFIDTTVPIVEYVSPSSAWAVGGDTVTVSVEDFNTFEDITLVTIVCGTDETSDITLALQVGNLLRFDVVMPSSAARADATCDIKYDSADIVSFGFEFVAKPNTAAAVVYQSVYTADSQGGESVTVNLQGFYVDTVGHIVVKVDGGAATVSGYSVVGDVSIISFSTPSHAAGTVVVEVYPSDRVGNKATFSLLYTTLVPDVLYVWPSTGTKDDEVSVAVANIAGYAAGDLSVKFNDYDAVFSVGSGVGVVMLTVTVPDLGPSNLLRELQVAFINSTNYDLAYFAYIAPEAAAITGASPTSGPQYGGTSITIGLADPQSAYTTPDDVSFQFGSVMVDPMSFFSTGANNYAFIVQTPVGLVGTETVKLFYDSIEQGLTFDFTFMTATTPTFLSLSPDTGLPAGGEFIALSLLNVPPMTQSQCVLKVDNKRVTVSSLLQNTFVTDIGFFAPAGAEGTVLIEVYRSDVPSVKYSGTIYTYAEPSPTAAGQPDPAVGSKLGGTVSYITISYLPDNVEVSDLTIKFDLAVGTVESVTDVGDDQHVVSFTTPEMTETGVIESEIFVTADEAGSGAKFYFTFNAPSQPVMIAAVPQTVGAQGGTNVRFRVSKLPVVDSVDDVRVRFVDASHDVTPTSIVSSTVSETILWVEVPALRSHVGSVPITIFATRAISLAATFDYTLTDPPAPITSLDPATGLVAGGETLTVEIEKFPVINDLSDVSIVIAAKDSKHLVSAWTSNKAFTRFIMTTPAMADAGDVAVAVTYLADNVFASQTFNYYELQPMLNYFTPTTGLPGQVVSVNVVNLPTYAFTLDATCTGQLQQIATPTVSGSVVAVVMPAFATGGGSTTCTLDIIKTSDSSSHSLTYDFVYPDASTPYVTSIYPEQGINLGGTPVLVNMAKLDDSISVSDLQLTIAGVIVKDIWIATYEANGGKTKASIHGMTPATAVFGDVDVVVTYNTDGDEATTSFKYLKPCDYETYCENVGLIVDASWLAQSPPSTSSCSASYCMEPIVPPSPYISSVTPSTLDALGGKPVTITVRDFGSPQDISKLSVFVDSVQTNIDEITESNDDKTVLTITTPFVSAEDGAVWTASVTAMNFDFTPPVEAESDISLFSEIQSLITGVVSPASGPLDGGNSVVITVTDTPPVPSTVAVLINGIDASDSVSVVTNAESDWSAKVYIDMPAALCSGSGCTQVPIKLTYDDRRGVSRTVTVSYDYIVPPVELIAVYPSSALNTGGSEVTLLVANLPSVAGVDVEFGDETVTTVMGDWSVTGLMMQLKVTVPQTDQTGEVVLTLVTPDTGDVDPTTSFVFLASPDPVMVVSPQSFDGSQETQLELIVGDMDLSDSYTINICGSDLDQNQVDSTVQLGNAYIIKLTVMSCDAGTAIMEIDNSGTKTATFDLTVTAPVPIVTPMAAPVGATVTIDLWNLDSLDKDSPMTAFSIVLNDLTYNPVSSSSLGNDWLRLAFVVPDVPVDSYTGTMNTTTFGLTVVETPSVISMSPSAGLVKGGDLVTLLIANFPVQTAVSDYDVTVAGEGVLPMSFQASSSQTKLVIRTPASVDPDTVQVIVEVGVFYVSQPFTYEMPAPKLAFASNSEDGMEGGLEVKFEVANFAPTSDPADLSVKFGDRWGTVTSITYSDVESTLFTVATPSQLTTGVVDVALSDGYSTIYTTFKYFDANIVPTALTVTDYNAAGGDSIVLEVQNFPAVSSASAVVAKFGDAVATVTAFTPPDNNRVSTYTVTTPSYAGTFVDGKASENIHVFLQVDDSVGFYVDMVYRSKVVPVSAEFTTGYSRISVTFNQKTNMIDDLIAAVDIAKYSLSGIHQMWSDAKTLVLMLPSTATILPGDALEFNAGLKAQDEYAGTDMEAGLTASVEPDAQAADPVASLSSVNSLGFCDSLKLSAAASSGVRLTYAWSSTETNMNAILEALSGNEVEVTSFEEEDFAYEITLTVTDVIGRQSSDTVTVYRSGLPLPTITIETNTLSVNPGHAVLIQGNAVFSSCADASQFTFEWEEVTTTGVPTATAGTALSIPSCVAGETYEFKFVGYPASEPLNKAFATATVTVSMPDLDVSIKGGATRDISSAFAFTVDASDSNDPADVEELSYSWTCMSASSSSRAVCRDVDNTLLNMGDTATVSVAANTMAPGTYDFELTVQTATRSATVSQSLVVVEAEVPSVVVTASPSMDHDNFVVSPAKRVILETTVEPDNVPIAWTVVEGSSPVVLPSDKIPMGSDGLTFIVEAGLLSAGHTYLISATATGDEGTATSAVSITINAPPSGGNCVVDPPAGHALVDRFKVVCSLWADDTPGAIKYTFGYVNPSTAEDVVVQASSTSSKITGEGTFLPEGNVDVWVKISDARGAAYRLESTVEVGAMPGEDAAQDQAILAKQQGDVQGALTIVSVATEAGSRRRRRSLVASSGTLDAMSDTLTWALGETSTVLDGVTSPNVINDRAAALGSALSSFAAAVQVADASDLTSQVMDGLSSLVGNYEQDSDFVAMNNEIAIHAINTMASLAAGEPSTDFVSSRHTVIQAMAKNLITGEPTSLIEASNDYSLGVRKMIAADAVVTDFSVGDAAFVLGTSVGALLDNEVNVMLEKNVVWSPPVDVISDAYSIELANVDGSAALVVEDLDEPVTVTITTTQAWTSGAVCRYWDGADWSMAGCTTDDARTDAITNTVVCECDHLSSFVVTDEVTERDPLPIVLVDDYLEGCVVYADTDGNGEFNSDVEPSCTTDANGACDLPFEATGFVRRFAATTAPETCLDVSTRLNPQINLASTGSVMSILTTLKGMMAADVLEDLYEGFDVCPILTCDPMTSSIATGASDAEKKAIITLKQVQNMAVLVFTYLDELTNPLLAADATLEGIKTALNTAASSTGSGSFDLTAGAEVITVVQAAAEVAGETIPIASMSALGNVVADLNTRVEVAIATSGHALRTRLAIMDYTTQDLVANDVEDLAAGDISVSKFSERTDSDALDDYENLAAERVSDYVPQCIGDDCDEGTEDTPLSGGAIFLIVLACLVGVGLIGFAYVKMGGPVPKLPQLPGLNSMPSEKYAANDEEADTPTDEVEMVGVEARVTMAGEEGEEFDEVVIEVETETEEEVSSEEEEGEEKEDEVQAGESV